MEATAGGVEEEKHQICRDEGLTATGRGYSTLQAGVTPGLARPVHGMDGVGLCKKDV